MATMLLVTHGSSGDVLPFLRLGGALRARGHDVTLLTHASFAEATRAAGLGFVPIDTAEEHASQQADEAELLGGQLGAFDPAKLTLFYERNQIFDRVRFEFDTLVERHRPGDTVVVARHGSGLSSLMAAEALGVPVAWVALTPMDHLSMPIHEFVYEQVLSAAVNTMMAAASLSPVRRFRDWLTSADAQICVWPEWFDAAGSPAPAGSRQTGFLLNDAAESGPLPPGLAELLDAPRPPILVTGTTGGLGTETFYLSTAEACRMLGLTAVMSAPATVDLPDLPDNVHRFPHLPFREVMPRTAAVVHHGGIGTTARALASGLPQLVLAHWCDRPDNAGRLRKLGVAEWLPIAHWTPERIASTLETVLTEPRYLARAGELRSDVDGEAAAAAACAALESLVATPVPA